MNIFTSEDMENTLLNWVGARQKASEKITAECSAVFSPILMKCFSQSINLFALASVFTRAAFARAETLATQSTALLARSTFPLHTRTPLFFFLLRKSVFSLLCYLHYWLLILKRDKKLNCSLTICFKNKV